MQNELAAKSAEEKNKLAVTMLVTGIYMSESNTGGKGFDTNSMLNSFLQSEINKIAGNALKTIDINFGMETTDEGETGNTRTDYNFQFAKRFWNNRFQVIIGGKNIYRKRCTAARRVVYRQHFAGIPSGQQRYTLHQDFSTTRITKAYSTVK